MMVALLRFMVELLTENVCSLWFSFFRHLVLISPTRASAISSVIYHFLKYTGLFGGGICKVVAAFLQLAVISTQS